jgi:hypothetical protein
MASDASSLSVYWTKLTIRDSLRARTKARPTSTSLDQAEQVGQGHQNRQDHQKDHEAGEEASEHPPPPSAEQALDRRDDQPAREESKDHPFSGMLKECHVRVNVRPKLVRTPLERCPAVWASATRRSDATPRTVLYDHPLGAGELRTVFQRYGLYLAILVEGLVSLLPTVPGLFEPPERKLNTSARPVGVDVHLAGA